MVALMEKGKYICHKIPLDNVSKTIFILDCLVMFIVQTLRFINY